MNIFTKPIDENILQKNYINTKNEESLSGLENATIEVFGLLNNDEQCVM